MPSLYTLTTQLADFLDAVDRGDIPEEAITDTLEALEGEIEQKIDDIASAQKHIAAFIDAIKKEEDELKRRRQQKERECERLAQYLAFAMESRGMKAFESARNKITFRTSSSTRITDESAYIEWAKENAPGTIKITASAKPVLDAIKKLTETTDVPFVVIEKKKNIQIK